jgi:hypothetical protein
MKVVRRYSGSDSFDSIERDGIVTAAVGCFSQGVSYDTRVETYADVLSAMTPKNAEVLVQFETHWWTRRRDRRACRRVGGTVEGSGWMAAQLTDRDTALRETVRELWIDKDLRFYFRQRDGRPPHADLDKWFQEELSSLDPSSIPGMILVAEEIWTWSFLLLKYASKQVDSLETHLARIGKNRGIDFKRNREPFEGFLV